MATLVTVKNIGTRFEKINGNTILPGDTLVVDLDDPIVQEELRQDMDYTVLPDSAAGTLPSGFDPTSNQTITGEWDFNSPGLMIIAATSGVQLSSFSGNILVSSDLIIAGDNTQIKTDRNIVGPFIEGSVNGDAEPRLGITNDGEITWGDGTNPTDTNLYRGSAGILATDSNLRMSTDGVWIRAERGSSGLQVFGSRATGDAGADRFQFDAGGSLAWSDGMGGAFATLARNTGADLDMTTTKLTLGSGVDGSGTLALGVFGAVLGADTLGNIQITAASVLLGNDDSQPTLTVTKTGDPFPSAKFWSNSWEFYDPATDAFIGGLSGSGSTVNLAADGANNIVISSGSGNIQIGTTSADPIGFHGATPVVQAAHIADPVDLPTALAAIASILDILEAKGLMAP